jgi:hypothetical protein
MTIIGAGLDTFWIPQAELPTHVAPMLALRYVGSEDEVRERHQLQIRSITRRVLAARPASGREVAGRRGSCKEAEAIQEQHGF